MGSDKDVLMFVLYCVESKSRREYSTGVAQSVPAGRRANTHRELAKGPGEQSLVLFL